jgi:hypothetical protein
MLLVVVKLLVSGGDREYMDVAKDEWEMLTVAVML